MRRYLVLALACACVCAALSLERGERAAAGERSEAPASDYQLQIDRYRKVTWRWQRVMSVARTIKLPPPLPALEERVPLWQQRAAIAYRNAQRPPHRQAWTCIHRYEGSWTDGGAPYYGGLQMDWGFMTRYGRELLRRKGTADHWTPLEQMWVAERALRAGRGFYPWPNTARYCGLI
jgi:hypothetical protein